MRSLLVVMALALVLLPAQALAQNFPDGNVTFYEDTADPVGTCLVGQEFFRTDTALRWTCADGTWVTYGAAGGPPSYPLLAPDDGIDAPAYSFLNDTDMGVWRGGGPSLNFQNQGSVGGYLGRSRLILAPASAGWQANDDVTTSTGWIQTFDEGGAQLRNRIGASADVDNQVELYMDHDNVSFTVESGGANVNVVNLGTTGTSFTAPVLLPNGSFAAPALTFSGDLDSGLYYLSNGPAMQNQASSVIPGRTWTIWQDENWSTQMWYSVNTAASRISMSDGGTDEPYTLLQNTMTDSTKAEIEIFTGATPRIDLTINDSGGGDVTSISVDDIAATFAVPVVMTGALFAALGAPADGTFVYCSDCTKATPCAGVGNGALAKRLNGAWDCD